MKTENFLLEIGTEELPAKNLQGLAKTFAQHIKNHLAKAQLSHGNVLVYATPRRLAIYIEDLAVAQENRTVERKGPSRQAAFDSDGNPTPACLGFARSCGISVDQLETRKTPQGEWLFCVQKIPGQSAKDLLPSVINDAIHHLAVKKMRWGSRHIQFIRPVHWVVMLLGKEIINAEILGQTVSHKTYGHRFLHPKAIDLKNAAEYSEKLFAGKVMASFEERKENIRQQIVKLAAPETVIIDENLLDEVTGLVEWPVALKGSFDPHFLEIPAEVLMTAMKNHQKSFPIVDKKNNLLPHFITIANLESKNSQRVIEGNERVIAARLSDAAFFYHSDLKHRLENRLENLKQVIFQNKLGTLADKSVRISLLAKEIAAQINNNSDESARAGLLCKADLLSEMVSEFPELQGIMGYYYALQDKEKENVAVAIKEHYQPRFAGDELPKTAIGSAVAIADRLDTLVGIFGIHQAPSGEKDPFGLRRAALGILRIIIEKQLSLDLKTLLEKTVDLYQVKLENSHVVKEALDFILERLRAWYADQQIDAGVFNAVLARYPMKPLDFHHRILAVQHFLQLPQAKALIAANKRVSNILKKQDGISIHTKVNPALLEQLEEKQLALLLEQKFKEVEELCKTANYTEALTTLASLQQPIDLFFDKVMVMVEDEKLRHNRLALLTQLRHLFLQIADVSLLQ